MSITGDSVQIDPGYDKRTRTETFESKQSGLSVALSGAAGGALNTAVSTAQQARKESGGRLQALQGTKAALSGVQAGQPVVMEQAKDSSGKIIFLEKGNSKAGLQHIVKEHGSQFSQIGVSEARIPDVVMKAVTDGKIVGYQGTGTGRQSMKL